MTCSRGDSVCASLLDQLGQRRRIVPPNMLDQRYQRPERIGVRWNAADGGAVRVHAVVGMPARKGALLPGWPTARQ
jgi:hypothetical protein